MTAIQFSWFLYMLGLFMYIGTDLLMHEVFTPEARHKTAVELFANAVGWPIAVTLILGVLVFVSIRDAWR